ncbi:hypothetical protein CHS0354_000568 [Potamilus streckersoni]|uniref:Capsule assembly Wzi family protein n=1 Tax=Potamilus streckersoni TaxID=2493646 RepID=A0AAE0W984_9BIVA|nr:hypothetical protein CHS0354_000568 [Potamilus streckersoni]
MIPLDDDQAPHAVSVYQFITNMHVAGFVKEYDAGYPNLSRAQVLSFLKEVESHSNELSQSESDILNKLKKTWGKGMITDTHYAQLIGIGEPWITPWYKRFAEIVSPEKEKIAYFFENPYINVHVEFLGGYVEAFRLLPSFGESGRIIEGGLRLRDESASRNELVPQYNFIQGHTRVHVSPTEDMDISLQLAHEPIKLGFGESSSLIFSNETPAFDFVRLDFKYGVFSFAGIYASGVGPFSLDRTKNFSKYYAVHFVRVAFPKLFSLRVWDIVSYGDRIELAYFNPLIMFKFIEEALQDRDNPLFGFDVQFTFIDNLAINFTMLLDDISANTTGYGNKYAFQANILWYKAFGISNFSLAFEYTHIRPFVYSHWNPLSSYNHYGTSIGHKAGPNSQNFYLGFKYYPTHWLNINFSTALTRSGENRDETGTFIKDVGRNPLLHPTGLGSLTEAPFLDGIRLDSYTFTVGIKIEPLRNYIISLNYEHTLKKWLNTETIHSEGWGYMQLTIEY